MWGCLKKIRKDRTPIVLFGSEPFSSLLRISNLKEFKYDWVRQKSKAQHFAQAPYRPMTNHEIISVFSITGTAKNAKLKMKYNPQGIKKCYKVCKGKKASHSEHRKRKKNQSDYIQKITGYPKTIIMFNNKGKTVHPTQKPLALMEYFIKTYSLE
jgi:site-specific DNA-methyltransferase (adenine-specific)